MKKNGFISTSVIYTILIVFLLMLMTLLLYYFNNRMLLTDLKDDLRTYLYDNYSYVYGDIVVYIWANGSLIEDISELSDDYTLSEQYCKYNESSENIDIDSIDNNTNDLIQYEINLSNATFELYIDQDIELKEQINCYFYFGGAMQDEIE